MNEQLPPAVLPPIPQPRDGIEPSEPQSPATVAGQYRRLGDESIEVDVLGGRPSQDVAPPFEGAFIGREGERVDLAAAGPLKKIVELLARQTAPIALEASAEALAKQEQILRGIGHSGPLPDKAVNINFDHLAGGDDVNRTIAAVAEALGGDDPAGLVQRARRGRVSDEETLEQARSAFRRDEGFVWNRKVGEAANAHEITATRFVMATLRDRVTEHARLVVAGKADPETTLAFRRGLAQMAAVQLQLHGMAAEAGRALRAFRIDAVPGLLDLAGGDGAKAPRPKAAQAAAGEATEGAPPIAAPGAGAPGAKRSARPAPPPAPPPAPANPMAPAPSNPMAPAPANPMAPAPQTAADSANQSPPLAGVDNAGQGEAGAAAEAPAGQTAKAKAEKGGLPQTTDEVDAAAERTQDIQNMLMMAGGNSTDLARQFLALPSPAAQNTMAKATVQPGFADMSSELFYNYILSGLQTQLVNFMGNLGTLAITAEERQVAALHGKLFGFLGGREGVQMRESQALVSGYMRSLGDAWRLANFAFKYGIEAGSQNNYRMPVGAMDIWMNMDRSTAEQLAAGGGGAGGATNKLTPDRPDAITGANVLGAVPNAVNRMSQHVTNRDLIPAGTMQNMPALARLTDTLSLVIDSLGYVGRSPTRLLGAADQFFKAVAYHGELRAQAMRDAQTSGFTGQRLHDYVDAATTTFAPLPADKLAAERYARNITMTESMISDLPRHLQGASTTPFMYNVAPFVRVTTNLLDFATERALFGVRPSWWKDISGQDPVKRDLAAAKATTGAMAWVAAFAVASNMMGEDDGAAIVVTGGAPADPNKRRIWEARGMRQYSVRIDGKWTEYSRLDPGGQMIGIAADSVNVMALMEEADADEFAAALIAAIGNNILNKTYMSSIAESMEVFTSYDQQQWERWVRSRAASHLVPNLVSTIVAEQDPYLRKAVTFRDEMIKRTDAKERAKVLAKSRDIFGRPRPNEWAFGHRMTGIRMEEHKPDPVADELQRLDMTFTSPSAIVRGVELTPLQHDRYQELAGNALKLPADSLIQGPIVYPQGRDTGEQLNIDMSGLGMHDALKALVRHPLYKWMSDGADPPGQKAFMIESIRNIYRERAQMRLAGEYPELQDQMAAHEEVVATARGERPEDTRLLREQRRTTFSQAADAVKDYEVEP